MPRASAANKTPTNLSVRSDLVRRAKQLGLNLSQLFERALEAALEEHEREQWRRRNAEAIERYNDRVAEQGVFSDEWRRF
jgi:antitoxin CcdA